MTHEHDHYPKWCDIEHQETDLALAGSVSDALRPRAELPILARMLAEEKPRTPAERERCRAADAAPERLIEQLRVRVRPFGMPEGEAPDQNGG